MATVKLTKGLFPGFTPLGPSIFYFDPQSHDASTRISTSANQPDLVILSTWMGAAPKHISKYVSGYQKLYPKSPVLILTNTIMDIIQRTRQSYKDKLKPAVRIIHETAVSRENPKILLHLFSNGGANLATSLAYFYRQKFDTPFPVSSMVLDSAPGVATYRRSIAAMSVGLPRSVLFRLISYIMMHMMCAAMWIGHHIFKQENAISLIRRQLVDPNLFTTSAPRVYVYSKTDKMVGWGDVEYNAYLAKQAGYDVRTELYESSTHVGHLRDDPKRYWDAVRRTVGHQDRRQPGV